MILRLPLPNLEVLSRWSDHSWSETGWCPGGYSVCRRRRTSQKQHAQESFRASGGFFQNRVLRPSLGCIPCPSWFSDQLSVCRVSRQECSLVDSLEYTSSCNSLNLAATTPKPTMPSVTASKDSKSALVLPGSPDSSTAPRSPPNLLQCPDLCLRQLQCRNLCPSVFMLFYPNPLLILTNYKSKVPDCSDLHMRH